MAQGTEGKLLLVTHYSVCQPICRDLDRDPCMRACVGVCLCVSVCMCVNVQRPSISNFFFFFCLSIDSSQLDHSVHPRKLREVSGP